LLLRGGGSASGNTELEADIQPEMIQAGMQLAAELLCIDVFRWLLRVCDAVHHGEGNPRSLGWPPLISDGDGRVGYLVSDQLGQGYCEIEVRSCPDHCDYRFCGQVGGVTGFLSPARNRIGQPLAIKAESERLQHGICESL